MADTQCLSCQIVTGKLAVPGGIVYTNESWTVASALHPVFLRGNLFLILNRHCEQLAELAPEETALLGSLIQKTCEALTQVLQPEKIYVASYGEGIKHIHFHIIPRMSAMPVGNGPVFLYLLWKSLLYSIGMKHAAYCNAEVVKIVGNVCEHLRFE